MARLDVKRAEDEASLKDVGIAMCAIDRLLGNDDSGATAAGGGGNSTVASGGYTTAASEAMPANIKVYFFVTSSAVCR